MCSKLLKMDAMDHADVEIDDLRIDARDDFTNDRGNVNNENERSNNNEGE